jgi:hypothetical protein
MWFSRKGIFVRSVMSQIYLKRLLHIVADGKTMLIECFKTGDFTINLQGKEWDATDVKGTLER